MKMDENIDSTPKIWMQRKNDPTKNYTNCAQSFEWMENKLDATGQPMEREREREKCFFFFMKMKSPKQIVK